MTFRVPSPFAAARSVASGVQEAPLVPPEPPGAFEAPPPPHAAATKTKAAPSVNSRGNERVVVKSSSTFWRALRARAHFDDGHGPPAAGVQRKALDPLAKAPSLRS